MTQQAVLSIGWGANTLAWRKRTLDRRAAIHGQKATAQAKPQQYSCNASDKPARLRISA